MKATAETRAAVIAVMDKWLQSYEQRDINGLMSLMDQDDDLFMFGTGIDEKRIGPAEVRLQAERDWAQTESLSFNFASHHISEAGPVAWVASEGFGQGQVAGQEIQFPMRMTAVMEKRNDGWRIVQAHVSVPAAGQEEGDSVPV